MSTHIKVTKDTEIKINDSIMFLETVLIKDFDKLFQEKCFINHLK